MALQFGMVWEDPRVEMNALDRFFTDDSKSKMANVFMIASAGETMLALLQHKPGQVMITAIDQNATQLALCKDKLHLFSIMWKDKNASLLPKLAQWQKRGLYEQLFVEFARSQQTDWSLFSTAALETRFGRAAVAHSPDFKQRFQDILERHNAQYVLKQDESNPFVTFIKTGSTQKQTVCEQQVIRGFDAHSMPNPRHVLFKQGNVCAFRSEQKYDLICLSNVTDWMPAQDRHALLSRLVRYNLHPERGIMTLRRMNGDYCLESLCRLFFERVELGQDSSCFYKQVCVCSNPRINSTL